VLSFLKKIFQPKTEELVSGIAGPNLGTKVTKSWNPLGTTTTEIKNPEAYFNQPSATPAPTAKPKSKFIAQAKPTPSPAPRVIANPVDNPNFKFDFSKYPSDQGFAVPTPPAAIAREIGDKFPNDATRAAIAFGTENPRWDPMATNSAGNVGGTTDYGIAQDNSGTLADLQRRKGNLLARNGIFTVNDLFNVAKNLKLAQIIYDEGGWGRWNAWKNKGFKL
jgi:hypothetical protein